MPEPFEIHTPKHPGAKKFFGYLFLLLIGLFVLLFVWKFVSTLWTIRYGSQEAKQALDERINPSFTLSPETIIARRTSNSKISARDLIHAYNPNMGLKQAPVKMIAFVDFECPYTQQAYPHLKKMMQEHGDVVELTFKHFPIGALHPNALAAATAASCANEQGKFWEYADMLLTKKFFDTSSIVVFANTLGLDQTQFQNCISSEKFIDNIQQDMQEGADVGVRGTPTFIIEGKKIEGVIDGTMLERLIIDALQKK